MRSMNALLLVISMGLSASSRLLMQEEEPCPVTSCVPDPCVDPYGNNYCKDGETCVTEKGPTPAPGCPNDCEVFKECQPCPVTSCIDPCLDDNGKAKCRGNRVCVTENGPDLLPGCPNDCKVFVECAKP